MRGYCLVCVSLAHALLNCSLLLQIYFLFVKITLNYSPPVQNTCSSSQTGVTASLKRFLFIVQPSSITNAANRADSCKCHR